ncbi:MAG: hypothetical protein ACFCVD_14150 [Nodosilinea sp.]
MQRSVSTLLTALLATVALTPSALAYTDLDEIRHETLEPLAQVSRWVESNVGWVSAA